MSTVSDVVNDFDDAAVAAAAALAAGPFPCTISPLHVKHGHPATSGRVSAANMGSRKFIARVDDASACSHPGGEPTPPRGTEALNFMVEIAAADTLAVDEV